MVFAQPSAALSVSYDAFATGITPGVQIVNAATGAVAVARTTSQITEVPAGSGVFLAQLTAPAQPGRYVVVWDKGSIAPPNMGIEDLVVSTICGPNGEPLQAGSAVTISGPVATGGQITIIAGDDYATADGRQLKFLDPTNAWPALTGATVSFQARQATGAVAGPATLTVAGTIIAATGSNKEVDVALTAAQTASLPAWSYGYDLVATLANGDKVSLAKGQMAVIPQTP